MHTYREVHISLSVLERILTSGHICVTSAQVKKQNITEVQTPPSLSIPQDTHPQ